ncbi:DUF1993 domain-containing protein [Arenimonas composti]|uniref:DUF1993 domain-containing protein n=1 Tax=Arenimonas composti TR7-09 = DSM 18010 TaxID=1121013 RepID=A0A091BZK0_9GAMM|nr:DUF1993 domain-containing protein [Arenimonas composti]KFN49790.1 hypothetical protein P873_09550 [Arenimonas composti TR7-09 = DSM 18010]
MSRPEIEEIQRIFLSRLDTLSHILDVGANSLDLGQAMQARLAPDMLPLGAQIAFACNQPRGFSQWCAGQPIENLLPEVTSVAQARAHIADTKARVQAISAGDDKLDEVKRIGLGPGRYCELPARQYVSDYLLPNLYFHITTTYAILRMLGAPVGKSDYMRFLAPHVRSEPGA